MTTSLAALIEEANRVLLVEGDLDRIPDFFTPDHVVHLTGKDMAGGHAKVRSVLRTLRKAFTDLSVDVDVFVVGGDRVAWQRTLRGTHQGPYGGFPATGRKMVWRDMATSRFQGERIAEEWLVSDLAERLLSARSR